MRFGALDPASLAALAVWLHARAGRRWQDVHGAAGMLAEELAAELPMVIGQCLETGM